MTIDDIEDYLCEVGNFLGKKGIRKHSVSLKRSDYNKIVNHYGGKSSDDGFYTECNDYGVELEVTPCNDQEFSKIIYT
jgi:hypothetical protein